MDADCLVAGVLTPTGATTALLDLWRAGVVEFVACPKLLAEIRRTLSSDRIARKYAFDPHKVNHFISALAEGATMLADPIDPPRVVPADPDDDYLIALALESHAVLVTRDRHFEDLRVEGLRIFTPGLLLRELKQDDE